MSTWNQLRRLTKDMAPWTLHDRLTRLEKHMATLDETITAIDAETTRIGTNVTEVAADLDALRDELAGHDQAAADRLAPLVTRLTGEADRLAVLAADPDKPVPPVEPSPETPPFA
ncbi:MAG: hypothetical protein ACRDSF_00625 [Pseudonocardiaceae bacterium]